MAFPIPDEHLYFISKVEKWLLSLDKSSNPQHVKKYCAESETLRIYEKYGFRAMRFAFATAKGKQNFITICKNKSKSLDIT